MDLSHPPTPTPAQPVAPRGWRPAGRQGAAGGAGADGRGGHEGLRAQQWDIIYGPINGNINGNNHISDMETM